MTEDRSAQARFGTFGGVFTPCVLTILGVIMFMRAGYVVGDVGIWRALGILAIAKGITGLTSLSLAAIATNTEVRTGGVYYMISRTLGPDFGGTIGLTLYVSQAISIAFYVIGFTEALFGLFAPTGSDLATTLATYRAEQWVSTGMVVVLFFVTFKGADLAIKAQYFILAVLLASVVSFIAGGVAAFDSGLFDRNTGLIAKSAEGIGPDGFWIAFAIFFPAATGITAGANMSGDLKDPARSIPRGTLLAIAFTAVIYLTELILLAGFSDQASLKTDPFGAIKAMSVFSPLVIAGVFAATLSSALGSFLGAPRILQAMGIDKLLRPLVYFGKGHGPSDEPRRATVLSLIIALCVVWSGGLDAVAKVISMFFLIAYGMINLSAFVEGRGGNPSFRPRFKLFGWPAAMAGTIGCAIAMVKIDETYAIIAMLIAGAIYFALRGRTGGTFGDAKRGYVFTRTRENLLALEQMTTDPKNWRPVLAVLTEDAERDKQLLTCASWIENERGLLSVLEVVTGAEGDIAQRHKLRQQRIFELQRYLHGQDIVAFADSVVVPTQDASCLDPIIQAYSIGSLRPNTVILSAPPPSQVERRERVAAYLRILASHGLNILIYKGARMDSMGKRRIDLWWHGQRLASPTPGQEGRISPRATDNGSLITLFAYLASTHSDWSQARIRMLRVVNTGAEHLEAERNLSEMMAAARLQVDVEVILSQRPVTELIVERSSAADLIFLGLRDQDVLDFQSFLAERDPMLTQLPPTILVLSNGEADLLA